MFAVRKLISALGCMPKKSGDSEGMVSMCLMYLGYIINITNYS